MKIQYRKEKKNVWHSIRITLFTEYFSKDKFSNLAYALFFLNRLKYEQEMVHTVFHFQKALLYDVFVPNNRTSCFSLRVNFTVKLSNLWQLHFNWDDAGVTSSRGWKILIVKLKQQWLTNSKKQNL